MLCLVDANSLTICALFQRTVWDENLNMYDMLSLGYKYLFRVLILFQIN